MARQTTLNVRKRKTRKTKSRGPQKSVKSNDPDTQVILYRPMGGSMKKATLIYSQPFTLTLGAAGVPAIQVFRANGMRDPDLTGVGGQPRGFDQYMAIWDHFVVLGSKITVHFGNQQSASNRMTFAGICVRDESAVVADATKSYPELGYNTMTLLTEQGGSNVTAKLEMAINPAKFLGRKNPLSDPELKGSSSVSPTEQVYYHVYGQAQTSATNGPLICHAVIEYHAAFIEGRDPGAS